MNNNAATTDAVVTVPTEAELNEKIDKLARSMAEQDAADTEYKALLAEFEQQHAGLIEKKRGLGSTVNTLKSEIKEGVMAYRSANLAMPEIVEVSIKQHNVCLWDGRDDDSPGAAVKRAAVFNALLQRAPMFLTINEKMLDDLAKAEPSARSVFVNALMVTLPEIRFTKTDYVEISEKKVLAREAAALPTLTLVKDEAA